MNQLKLALPRPGRVWAGTAMAVNGATPPTHLRLIADLLDALPSALSIQATLTRQGTPVDRQTLTAAQVYLNGAVARLTLQNPPRAWDVLPEHWTPGNPYQVILTVETL